MTAATDVLDVLNALFFAAVVAAVGVWLIVGYLVDCCWRRRAETRREHEARVAAQTDRDRWMDKSQALEAELAKHGTLICARRP